MDRLYKVCLRDAGSLDQNRTTDKGDSDRMPPNRHMAANYTLVGSLSYSALDAT